MDRKEPLPFTFVLIWIALLLTGCEGKSVSPPASSEVAAHTSTAPAPSSQSISIVTPEVMVTSSDFVSVTPLVSASYIQVASWSPDSQWIAYWISSQDDVEQPSNSMPSGTLNFMNVNTGQSCAVSQFTAANNKWAEVKWSDETEAIVVMAKDAFVGRPCQAEPYSKLDNYVQEELLTDSSLSPNKQYHVNTLLQSSKNGILTFETTITRTNGVELLQRAIWQIDERLGEYGLGGEWISKEQFLIYEALNQGPLIIDMEHGVIPVLTQLLGLEEIPSILGKEGYGFRALAIPGVERDSFHLLVQGVGTEANFPLVKLYHAENELVETIPFHYVWWKSFSDDGQWLLMDERPDIGGYESHVIWIRRVEEVDSDWQMIADDVDSLLWTGDWSEMAFSSEERVIWQTFPEAEHIGQWSTSQFWAHPIAWSPDRRLLVAIGNIPGFWKYGLFVLER